MPVPFDELGGDAHPAVAGWLRCVEEDDGRSFRAALFQATGGGEPLGFCFTRMDRRSPVARQSGGTRLKTRSECIKSLFRSATPSPTLLIGLVDEIPPGAFINDMRVGLPCCCISRPAGPSAVSGSESAPVDLRTHWQANEPSRGSVARELFDTVMGRDKPLEPLERAAEALAEAFSDSGAAIGIAGPGLAAVVNLSSIQERTDFHDSRRALHEPFQPSGREPGVARPLADRLRAILAAPCKLPAQAPDFKLDWPGGLLPFQREGVRALLDSDRLLLADDMGLGKTVQAIAALRILRARGAVRACLVVAPASLLDHWRGQIGKWAPDLRAIIVRGSAQDRRWQWAEAVDVTLVSYDTLRSDYGGSKPAQVRRRIWDVVIADEAQRIKNRNDTSEALKGLLRKRSWALTGTPLENHEEELASILEFVDHGGSRGPKRYRPGAGLLVRHRELQLRRKKGDVLNDLPPKQTTKLAISLNRKQRASYDKAERDGIVYLRSLGGEVGIQHVLALITHLKQICNADPQTGESAKLDDVRSRLQELTAQGHRALIFSQFISDAFGVGAAASRLREFNPLVITGDTPQQERTAVINRFRSGAAHKALVLSLRVGGLGLNLQEASYVFHVDRWWNPAMERQAEDRSHRFGQTAKVNVIKYSCIGTIEERIDAILERKQKLFKELIDDVSLDLSVRMSREELLGLFGLDPEPAPTASVPPKRLESECGITAT